MTRIARGRDHVEEVEMPADGAGDVEPGLEPRLLARIFVNEQENGLHLRRPPMITGLHPCLGARPT